MASFVVVLRGRNASLARRLLAITFVPALVPALALALASGCSGDGPERGAAAPTSTAPKSVRSPLKLGAVTIETWSADPASVKLAKSTHARILAVAQRYVDAATIAPLETGKLGAKFGALFAREVRAAATTTDRDALADAVTGRVIEYRQRSSPVRVSALADESGTVVYAAASFKVTVDAKTPDGRLAITREVELTLSPSGKTWVVSAYRVQTKRALPQGRTTTSSASSASTAAGESQ
jgi:hypothetical protein